MSHSNEMQNIPGVQMEAIVKWFNASKGFGFVEPADKSPDAFMHMSVLAAAGMQHIAEGTKLLVEIGTGNKGVQVNRIISVLGMVEIPIKEPTGPTEDMIGTVKWFKGDKGFGFASPDSGGDDVFVHRSVVLRAGVQYLNPDQKIKMKVQMGAKGREAVSIEVL